MLWPDHGDFESDLLSAKERDLKPLLTESEDSLGLREDQAAEMEAYLGEAWFCGAYAGRVQSVSRALEPKTPRVDRSEIERVEAEFKALMERSAEALDLTVDETITMWSLLGKAWIAGTNTCETEVIASFLEANSDVAEEALRWLEEKDEGK